MTNYLSLANLGQNQWWRYLLGLFLIAVFWQIIGAVPLTMLFIMVTEDEDPTTNVDLANLRFEGIDSLWPYLAINFTLLAMLVGVLLVIRFLHGRSIRSVITPHERINWRRIWLGFSVYFVLIAAATLGEALFKPQEYELTFNWRQFLVFLPIAILVTPLQAASEELLFRGYIMQGLGLLSQRAFVPVMGSSLLFMAAHLANPEVGQDAYLIPLLYLLLGLFLAVITVKSNSLELAIGVHAANNLFTVLIMNYANSALPAPSIFTAGEVDPVAVLISFSLIAVAFYWIVFVWRKESEEPSSQPLSQEERG